MTLQSLFHYTPALCYNVCFIYTQALRCKVCFVIRRLYASKCVSLYTTLCCKECSLYSSVTLQGSDFVCSLFPKTILFDFYFILLQLVLCRVAAVKSLPVQHHSAGYILFSLGSLSPSFPSWLF